MLHQASSENSSFAAYMVISLGCHIILMACLLVLSGFNGCQSRSFSSRVIDVDLVSLPDTGGRQAESAVSQPEEKTPATSAKKSVNVPARKATPVEVARPTDKVKKSLKSKTFDDSGQSVENAIARLEKRVEQEPPSDSVAKAISRLKQVEQGKQQSVAVSGGGGSTGRTRKELEAIEIYKLDIRYHILKNWVYSSQLAGSDEKLKAVIGITIAADGTITKTWFDKRSGNEYFDNSAYKAVLKSNPLPSLPEGYKTYTVGLEFTPSDLR